MDGETLCSVSIIVFTKFKCSSLKWPTSQLNANAMDFFCSSEYFCHTCKIEVPSHWQLEAKDGLNWPIRQLVRGRPEVGGLKMDPSHWCCTQKKSIGILPRGLNIWMIKCNGIIAHLLQLFGIDNDYFLMFYTHSVMEVFKCWILLWEEDLDAIELDKGILVILWTADATSAMSSKMLLLEILVFGLSKDQLLLGKENLRPGMILWHQIFLFGAVVSDIDLCLRHSISLAFFCCSLFLFFYLVQPLYEMDTWGSVTISST